MVTFEHALATVTQLTPEQQDRLINIVTKRRIEQIRQEIAQAAQKDIADFHRGELKSQPVAEIITELQQSLAS